MMKALTHTRPGRMVSSSLLALFAASMATSSAQAGGVKEDMTEFFDDMGAAANVTGPTAYQGQSAGYYTLGSAWTRFPQKTVYPANIQLPKVSAGCGGIDIFTGSFSFISVDEFVSMLKAIANNALGFAFQLAIESISPQIAGNLRNLQDVANKVNSFNINSCEAAAAAVGSLWPRIDKAESAICKSIGRSAGRFSDAVKERRGCDNGGERSATLASSTDQAEKDQMPTNKNYAWDMINKSPLKGESQELRELVMNMLGTVIVRARAGDDDPVTIEYIGAQDVSILDGLLDGTKAIQIRGCVDSEKCLELTNKTISPLGAAALKPKLQAGIQGIIDNVRKKKALTPDQIELLGMSSLPLYKIIAVNEATGFDLADSEKSNLAEVLAVQLLSSFAERLLSEAASGSSGNINQADQEILNNFANQVSQARLALDRRLGRLNGKLTVTFAMIDRAMMIESTLQSKLTPGLAASLNYSRGLSSQGMR